MNQHHAIENWGKTFECLPNKLYAPDSEEGISKVVQQCAQQKTTLRPMGSRYSYTPLICSNEAMISLDSYHGIEEINLDDMTVTVKGGTKLAELETLLFSNNLSLYNLGDINQQTIAGLIATGSHGTGLSFGIASTQITWIQMITADGSLIECSPSHNPELFKAAQVSLGVLGIITKVKIKVLPKYYMQQERNVVDFDKALSGLMDSFHNNRNYEFFWFPYTDYVFEKKHNLISEQTHAKKFKKLFNDYVLENGALWLLCELSRNFPNFYRKNANQILKNLNSNLQSTVPSTECYATTRLVNHREIEYSIPIEHALTVIQQIRTMLNQHETHVSFPIEVRCVAEDDIYLSPNYQRKTVWIAVHAYTKDEYESFFKQAENIFIEYGGRPHWGKMHWLDADKISALYPCLAQFKNIRQQMDPQGIFLNNYLDKLLGISAP